MEQPTFEVNIAETGDNYAQLVVEPLEQGFGRTLGNAIRRVLLGHIRGAAVTSLQIDGVNHQFTTLEGLKEDIIDLVLNVKQLKVAYEGKDPVTARLSAKGPGEVTARQIELPAGVEIANPDLVVAHLAEKSNSLNMTMTIESGQGYSPAEDRMVNTLGVIPVDAVYSPIVRVNFNVVDTRVGRFTNFDKLILDVWTDGTVTPEVAVKQAAEILETYFRQVVSPVSKPNPEGLPVQDNDPEVYKITVEELELPTRIANALRKAGLGTVKDIIFTKKEDIAKIKNLGNKSLDIIKDALEIKGVQFNDL